MTGRATLGSPLLDQRRGSYRGCILSMECGAQLELLRALHGGGRGSVNDALSAMARVVGDALWGRGIRGPVGTTAWWSRRTAPSSFPYSRST